ncbi:MAG: hypothetical protein BM564_03610 [Bacteroidetes bacterium MedPE-SWsnd-G2]|nr:MAG: hypothetical protein BM564_03610 [Bacteroidetes bacterium MedPE-SWsnd-G2]
MHSNNKHLNGYNIEALALGHPQLQQYVVKRKDGISSIDFGNPKAVKELNRALLRVDYNIDFWNFSDHNLCPAIPGRADYLLYLNDWLNSKNEKGDIKVLDIGTGATLVYPLLGNSLFNWSFLGSEVSKTSIENAQQIIDQNGMSESIAVIHQPNSFRILEHVLKEDSSFTLSMCNPPFFESEEQAQKATEKKLRGLGKDNEDFKRNFSGVHNELWIKGGERKFIERYILESSNYKTQVKWYSCLVSDKDLVRGFKVKLKKAGCKKYATIKMEHGHKKLQVLIWSYTDESIVFNSL